MAGRISMSKQDFQAALMVPDGRCRVRRFNQGGAGSQSLRAWIERQDVLEATDIYSEPVAQVLYEHGQRVSFINPTRIKEFGRSELKRAKTDRVDAKLIARFMATQRPEPWVPSPAAVRDLQARDQRLRALQIMGRQEYNRPETTAALQESIHRVRVTVRDGIDQLTRHIRVTSVPPE